MPVDLYQLAVMHLCHTCAFEDHVAQPRVEGSGHHHLKHPQDWNHLYYALFAPPAIHSTSAVGAFNLNLL